MKEMKREPCPWCLLVTYIKATCQMCQGTGWIWTSKAKDA